MFNRYNLNNLEALFKDFLVSGIKKSKNTIKNYLSDVRHFFGWIETVKQPTDFFHLSETDIEKYKKYLTDNAIPRRTINRRLSAIRKLCFFCEQTGILEKNPSKQVTNISPIEGKIQNQNHISTVINEFHNDLISEGISTAATKNYINEIQRFFSEVKNYG